MTVNFINHLRTGMSVQSGKQQSSAGDFTKLPVAKSTEDAAEPSALVAVLVDCFGDSENSDIKKAARSAVNYELATARHNALENRLAESLLSANRKIYELLREKPTAGRAGASALMVGISQTSDGLLLRLAHVGNCRVSLLRNGQLFPLSNPQTWHRHYVESGILSSEDKITDPELILPRQYLGERSTVSFETNILEPVQQGSKPTLPSIRLNAGDRILLTTVNITVPIIQQYLDQLTRQTPENATRHLVDSLPKEEGDSRALMIEWYKPQKVSGWRKFWQVLMLLALLCLVGAGAMLSFPVQTRNLIQSLPTNIQAPAASVPTAISHSAASVATFFSGTAITSTAVAQAPITSTATFTPQPTVATETSVIQPPLTTPTLTPSATSTPSATATETPTSSPTATQTASATSVATSTATDTQTQTPIPTDTPEDTPVATETPTKVPTPTKTNTPQVTPTTAASTPSVSPTAPETTTSISTGESISMTEDVKALLVGTKSIVLNAPQDKGNGNWSFNWGPQFNLGTFRYELTLCQSQNGPCLGMDTVNTSTNRPINLANWIQQPGFQGKFIAGEKYIVKVFLYDTKRHEPAIGEVELVFPSFSAPCRNESVGSTAPSQPAPTPCP